LNGPNSQNGIEGCHHFITPGTCCQGIQQCIEALVGGLSDRIGKRIFLAFEKLSRIGRVGVDSRLKPAFEDLLFFLLPVFVLNSSTVSPRWFPQKKQTGRYVKLKLSVRILTLGKLCNSRKPADFKVEPIVNLPFSVKDK
jgi:hypothetical protein